MKGNTNTKPKPCIYIRLNGFAGCADSKKEYRDYRKTYRNYMKTRRTKKSDD
jgi:hypothetical protein